MATALAAQLQALAVPSESNRTSRTRPSILFDAREAADIDTDTIFSLALSGLEELATANHLFTNFKKTLFSVESRQIDRELQGQEYNASLDASVHSFFSLVADFLLLSSAHQTLEYLIRRHKVHIYNVEDLIKFTLPYHETSLFVRVVQLSSIEKTRWRFLEGVKKSGAAPPWELLVQQCVRDMAVLEGICESGQTFKISGQVVRSRTTYSFGAAIVMEVLNGAQSVDSTLVNRVLPFIAQSFDKSSLEEAKVGGLMLVGTLTNKAKLSEETISLLFNLIGRVISNDTRRVVLLEMGVMVMIKLMQTQCIKSLPENAFRLIVKVRELPEILSKLSTTFHTETALALLIKNIIKHCPSSPRYGQVLKELLDAVPLRAHAEAMVRDILELMMGCLESHDKVDGNLKAMAMAGELIKVLIFIKDSFPKDTDNAINIFVESHAGTKHGLLPFLNRSFSGSFHAILPESKQSLYKSLEHPQSHIRTLALQRVSTIGKSDPKMKAVCCEALLVGLNDTDLSVVKSVISVDGLEHLIGFEELLGSLTTILERCVALLERGTRSSRAEAVSVGKRCLQFMASLCLEASQSSVEMVGRVFLSVILLSAKTWKLNLAALQLARDIEWSFFKGLSAIKDVSLKLEDKSDKESRKVWMHGVNARVVDSLANSLSENLESLASQLIACANMYERVKPLIVLVLMESLKRAPEGLTWEAVNKYLGFLKQEWTGIEISEEFPAMKLNNEENFRENVLSYEVFKMMEKEPKWLLVLLLLSCFHRVLMVVPAAEKVSKQDDEKEVISVLEDLFVIFSSPHSRTIFKEHLRLLLTRISIPPVVFLSSFFNAEGGTVLMSVQTYSLTVLLSHLDDAHNLPKLDMQVALPHLVAALASPVKAIRRGACQCLKKLLELWRESAQPFLPNGSQMQKKLLDSDTFEKFLGAIVESELSVVSSGDFLCTLLTSLLAYDSRQKKREEENQAITTCGLLFKKSAKVSVFQFLLHSAFTMHPNAQYTLVVALKGAVSMRDQAVETRKPLDLLLRRWRAWKLGGSIEGSLSRFELLLLKHFLQLHLHYEGIFSVSQGKVYGKNAWFRTLMEVINIDEGGPNVDSDVIDMYCTVLSCLEARHLQGVEAKCQDFIFKKLIQLRMQKQEVVQVASRASLHTLQVHSSIVGRYINTLVKGLDTPMGEGDLFGEDLVEAIRSLTAVLEYLLSRDVTMEMHDLVPVLFLTLRKIAMSQRDGSVTENLQRTGGSEMEGQHLSYLQQLVLAEIERIAESDFPVIAKDRRETVYDVDFLVVFIQGTSDVPTLNQALSLLTVLGRVSPDLVLEHVISVFSVMGETTLIQEDTHSYVVTEKLLNAVIPSWLEKMKDPRLLLQTLVKALPDIPSHRRIPLLKTTIRLMQESTSLHVLLLLLLESSLSSSNMGIKVQQKVRNGKRKSEAEADGSNWSNVSVALCEQYNLSTRLPALLKLLESTHVEVSTAATADAWKLQDKAVDMISMQLQKMGFTRDLENKENHDVVWGTLVKMLEEVLSLIQRVSDLSADDKMSIKKAKSSLQANAGCLLECIMGLLSPISFAEGMIHLLQTDHRSIRIRALRLIAAKMKSGVLQMETSKRTKNVAHESDITQEDMPKEALNAYERLVEAIGTLLAQPLEDDTVDMVSPAVLALHSCSQQLAKRIPSVFVASLHALVAMCQGSISSASAALQCMASIISETGLHVLPVLDEVITGVTSLAKQHSSLPQAADASDTPLRSSAKQAELHLAVLATLEAVFQKLGSFLSPYLDRVLDLLVLEASFLSSTNKNLCKKADAVRRLLPKAIPVRLLLNPLIKVYDRSLERGEPSLLACLELLSLVVASFDRASASAHYKIVFEICLRSFDLRRRRPEALASVTLVETSVISLFCGLVMKLSENTFKPLFVRILEWAESDVWDDETNAEKKSGARNVVFYRVVSQLGERLRSVFVPYFQYIVKGCVQQLGDGQHVETSKPRKKAKVAAELMRTKPKVVGISNDEWHLRYLIVSALHKCFLYDNMGFLDEQKFQMLLGPIVRQITIEKPPGGGDVAEWVPTTQDMDEALIACLGQMAITAGTDLLWKPLNHEVLLCTRNESVRVKMVSLDVVKFLVEHLKEDYLALLPETIPFLAELLEDPELSVVARSQEIIKLLEELSGESLAQYL